MIVSTKPEGFLLFWAFVIVSFCKIVVLVGLFGSAGDQTWDLELVCAVPLSSTASLFPRICVVGR